MGCGHLEQSSLESALTAAVFQHKGTFPSIMTLLKRAISAGWRDGHFFTTVYEIRLKGEGGEDDLNFLITWASSCSG